MKIMFLFSTFLLSVLAEAGTACVAPQFPGSMVLDDKEHRAHKILARLLEKTEIKSIQLCVWQEETKESRVEVCCPPWKEMITIALSHYTLTYFSDSGLSGAFAHEIGHIIGEPDIGEAGEQKADVVALALVGVSALRVAYFEHSRGNKGVAQRRVARALSLMEKKKKKI